MVTSLRELSATVVYSVLRVTGCLARIARREDGMTHAILCDNCPIEGTDPQRLPLMGLSEVFLGVKGGDHVVVTGK